MTDYKYKEIIEKIIGSATKVHAALGNGFQEVIYPRALGVKTTDTGRHFAREFSTCLCYENQQIGERRVGFFVEEKIMVEIEAISQLENVHLAQAKNYIEAYNIQIGLLLNFGSISLQFNRPENQKFVGNPFPQNQ